MSGIRESGIAASREISDVDVHRKYCDGVTALQISARLAEVQFAVLFASRAMCRLSYDDPRYWRAREQIERAMIHVHRAKWFTGSATGLMIGVLQPTHADEDVKAGLAEAAKAAQMVAAAQALLAGTGEPDGCACGPLRFDDVDAEIRYLDGVPLVPAICPIILLEGSSYEMGRQYARQSLAIFGRFIFERYAEQRFTRAEYENLRRWEAALATHAPEILEMVRGWAAGATEAGVPMRYENVLVLWTTDLEPARAPEGMMDSASALFGAAYAGLSAKQNDPVGSVVDEATDLCSGACAWGSATKSGGLVAAATTDHDCWFQATVIAYPDTGHPFIFTPFSVTGWLPGLGNTTMAGMPGVNAKGLVLVHHGGDPKMVEPPDSWGFGIRKAAAIFHILRFAATVKAAQQLESRWPISDVGRMMGAPGAFWADSSGAYIAESRAQTTQTPDGIVRTHTADAQGNQHCVLYATNNAIDPRSGRANGGGAGALAWTLDGGWHTTDQAVIGAGATVQGCFARWSSRHAAARNRFLARRLLGSEGRIDFDWLLRLYRTPGEYPAVEDWAARMLAYKSGADLACSAAHRGNAFTTAIDPGAQGGPIYAACVGPARRDLPPRDNSHGFHYFDETNAFWTIQLRSTASAAVEAAALEAERAVERACELLSSANGGTEKLAALARWLAEAQQEVGQGWTLLREVNGRSASTSVEQRARSLRAFTRAQVRARQVLDVIESPGDLDSVSASNGPAIA